MDIIFSDLPPSGSGTGRPSRDILIATQLREHPGEWAKIKTYRTSSTAASTASRISDGYVPAWQPVGAFEAVSRGRDVWARYLGAEFVRQQEGTD